MTFEEYQKHAESTDVFTKTLPIDILEPAFMAKILGLSGEAGEVAEKFKKIIRDKDGHVSDDDTKEIIKELGDVLWYVALIAGYLGSDLNTVAQNNVNKLADRHSRNMIQGSGDNR
jgi:NTP pyrophosphatase (non-canonical NTP hydrolase)